MIKLYWLLQIKRFLEQIFMAPWIWYGRLCALKEPKEPFDLFLFFPNPAVGGAEKVNVEVIRAFQDKKILVFFTKKPRLGSLLKMYEHPNVKIKDISRFTDNKLQYWKSFIWRGICSSIINQQKGKIVVFIGQCNFGYKVLPHLRKDVRRVELIHVSEKKFAWITFPFIPLIDCRITVGKSIRDSHLAFYKQLGVPFEYYNRWKIILYSIPFLNKELPLRCWNLPLKVYYAGRGGYQKRLWLLFEIIRQTSSLSVEWHLAGPFQDEIPTDIKPLVKYHGIIDSQQQMYDLHLSMDVLLLTSGFEGFPLVIMEAMANGVVPIATAVDAIPEHIIHGENGYLLQNPNSEQMVIFQAVELIKQLSLNPSQLKPISNAAYEYASSQFTQERFNKQYRNVFLDFSNK